MLLMLLRRRRHNRNHNKVGVSSLNLPRSGGSLRSSSLPNRSKVGVSSRSPLRIGGSLLNSRHGDNLLLSSRRGSSLNSRADSVPPHPISASVRPKA